MRNVACAVLLAAVLSQGARLFAAESATLRIELPAGTKVVSASAEAEGLKLETAGAISGSMLTFEKLLSETPYNVKLTLADGTVVQGVDLNWYDEEEGQADAGPLNDDDRDQIGKIASIDAFYNKHEILAVRGNHDRAAILVQLIRDKDFYAGAGQVIWRVEIYYFKNQHGGWEKISQQNKIIRRERFKSHDEFAKALSKIRFAPALGGIKLSKDQSDKTVKIESGDFPNWRKR